MQTEFEQVKFGAQSASLAHAGMTQRCVDEQVSPEGQSLLPKQPGPHACCALSQAHGTGAQMDVPVPPSWQSASLVHGCSTNWQIPHPGDAPGGKHSFGGAQSALVRHPAGAPPPPTVPVLELDVDAPPDPLVAPEVPDALDAPDPVPAGDAPEPPLPASRLGLSSRTLLQAVTSTTATTATGWLR